MEKKMFRLRILDKPYRKGMDFSAICHKECIPPLYGNDYSSSGYIIVREEKEDEEYIKDKPCLFCHKI